MTKHVPPASQPPRRCGNCHHAVRSAALDGSTIACLIRLEYHCADRVPDCGEFRPHGDPCRGDSENA